MADCGRVPGLDKFAVTGENLSERWTEYKSAFSFYAAAIGVTLADDIRKRDLFLHTAGSEIQKIFKTFVFGSNADGTVHSPSFEEVCGKFDERFKAKKNKFYERHLFHQVTQREDETIDEFVTRIRQAALYCEFENQHDDNVISQFLEKCKSVQLRERLLREPELNLDKMLTIARAHELSRSQAIKMATPDKSETHSDDVINSMRRQLHVRSKTDVNRRENKKEWQIKCSRCGRFGHISSRCEVARDKECLTCGRVGHFAAVCRTSDESKTTKSGDSHTSQKSKYRSKFRSYKTQNTGRRNVQYVAEDENNSEQNDSEQDYVFVIDDDQAKCRREAGSKLKAEHPKMRKCDVTINKQTVRFVLDTGATVNVITEEVWNKIRTPNQMLRVTKAKVFTYGSEKPLRLLGECELRIKIQGTIYKGTFVVVEGQYPCLLGHSLCQKSRLVVFPEENEYVYTVNTDADLQSLLKRYGKVFQGVGMLNDREVSINLKQGAVPIKQPLRRYPYHVKKQLKAEIERLEKLGIIKKLHGPAEWLTPLVVVPKPDNTVRLCLDMRQPNLVIEDHKYPVPLVEEIIQKMDGAEYFSELDFVMGFHQCKLDDKSQQITTFATDWGLYQYTRLNFGTKSAPELFHNIISDLLRDCEGTDSLWDNVVVYGKTQKEHNCRLEQVLKRIHEKGLTLNKRKCKFMVTRLPFMGYVISRTGVCLGTEKVTAIKEAREPTSQKEVRSFLGLVTFCTKFIPNTAHYTTPLRNLLKKNSPWHWGEAESRAFSMLKKLICEATELSFFNLDYDTEVIVDASPYGLGAVLVQYHPDGVHRPIAFASRSLTSTECKYSQLEKEALSCVWACERFHMYLFGKPFKIITDHKPLEVIYGPKSRAAARIERWLLRLQNYNYEVCHIRGDNNIADSLSRLLTVQSTKASEIFKSNELQDIAEEYVTWVASSAIPKAMSREKVQECTKEDQILQMVMVAIRTGSWSKVLNEYKLVKHQLTIQDGLVMKDNCLVIPTSLRKEILMIAHETHIGIVRMKGLLRTKVWWPKINADVETFVQNCLPCLTQGRPEKAEPLKMTTESGKPWEHVAIDICGPFPNGQYLLVLVDYITKWPEAKFTGSITTSTVINWLDDIFARFGFPEKLTCDNGTQFASEEFKSYLRRNGVHLQAITPYWPQANGQVERLNAVFLKAFRAAVVDKKNFMSELPNFLRMYRSTPHTVTKVSPVSLLLGRELRSKFPNLVKIPAFQKRLLRDAHTAEVQAKQSSKQHADRTRNLNVSSIEPGDFVLVKQLKKNKLTSRFATAAWKVTSRRHNSVVLCNSVGAVLVRPLTHVKRVSPSIFSEMDRDSFSEHQEEMWTDDLDDIQNDVRGNAVEQDRGTVKISRPSAIPKRVRRRPEYLKDFV